MKFTFRMLQHYWQRTCCVVNFITRKDLIWFSFHIVSGALRPASERRGNNLKGCQDFYLKTKVRIWLWLHDVCRILSTSNDHAHLAAMLGIIPQDACVHATHTTTSMCACHIVGIADVTIYSEWTFDYPRWSAACHRATPCFSFILHRPPIS